MSIESLKERLSKAVERRRQADAKLKAAKHEARLAEDQFQKINRQLYNARLAAGDQSIRGKIRRTPLPPVADIVQVLEYNAQTGVITWKKKKGRATKGEEAGYVDGSGYRTIGVFGQYFKAHRLAFWIAHGRQPDHIDHIDGDRLNNALGNLQAVSHADNIRKTQKRRKSSGYMGVQKSGSKWRAIIGIEGRPIDLGSYDLPEDASKAYEAAKVNSLGCKPEPTGDESE